MQKCGASLEVDLDNMQMFCQYCGAKLAFDISSEDLVSVLKEKEETKRKEIALNEKTIMLEHIRKEEKSLDLFVFAGLGGFAVIIAIFCIIMSFLEG